LDENVTGMGINLWGKDEVRDLGGVGGVGGGDVAGGKKVNVEWEELGEREEQMEE